MKTVNITINGRSFSLACKPEEENYLMELVAELNKRTTEIISKSDIKSDSQMLLMVALSILDELKEAKQDASTQHADMNNKITASLKSVSDRIEKLAESANNR